MPLAGAPTKDGGLSPDALYAAAVGLWRERRRGEAIALMDEALNSGRTSPTP